MNSPIKFTSTLTDIVPVDFGTAVLQGFAPDGGLFVPNRLPRFSKKDLAELKDLSYTDLCFQILSRFIDPAVIPSQDLNLLIKDSFKGFPPDVIPLAPCPDEAHSYILELFHGPTLSFKDIAMGFLVRAVDYLLKKENRRLNIVLATTGDTGPAAAHAAANLSTINCWPLFPKAMITPEQEGQMTGIKAKNIHPVGVTNCPDGGDDLDQVVYNLFNDPVRKKRLKLSSVNSINWCRVMVQSVHYFYAYFRVCRLEKRQIGDPVIFSVPSGAFGNLFAGYLARQMGLPVDTFICAVNANQTLYRAFTQGIFQPKNLIPTCSSAIDIVLPYNFWRFLYFASGCDKLKLRRWMEELEDTGRFELDAASRKSITQGFHSVSILDDLTLKTIKSFYETDQSYLLDPHGAVAVAGAKAYNAKQDMPVVCFATAHPAKFPDVTAKALGLSESSPFPNAAQHTDLVNIPESKANLTTCPLDNLEDYLINAMETSL